MLHLAMAQNSPLWNEFKETTNRITSTEIASVLHLSEYKAKSMLWKEKNKRVKKRRFENAATRLGKLLEPVAIWRAVYLIDSWDQFDFKYFKPGAVLDPLTPTACSPDIMMCCNEIDTEYYQNYQRIGQPQLSFGIEVKVRYSRPIPHRIDDVESQYIIQAFSSIHITKANGWYLFFMNKEINEEMSLFFITPNYKIWEEITDKVKVFISLETEPKRKSRKDAIISEILMKEIKKEIKIIY